MATTVTYDEIVKGLKELGLKEGDVVFTHTSLKSFGHVEGGAKTVIRAALHILGESGTLVAPTFVDFFWGGPNQVWDRENTPSQMGIISETLRTWPGARRSRHAPHPVSAVGRLAEDLTELDNLTDFSFDSPFFRLLELNAWIVLMGVEFNICTMLHLVEEIAEIPHRHWIDLTGTVIENGVAENKTYPFLMKYPDISNNFVNCGRELESRGMVKKVTIGQSTIKAVRARDLYEFAIAKVRYDPLYLVSAETKSEARKHLPKWGELQYAQVQKELPLYQPKGPVSAQLARKLYVTRATKVVADLRKRWETQDGLVLEEVRLSGGVHDFVPGMLAYPKDHPEPLPAMICLHGSGGTWQRLMEAPFVADGVMLRGWAREMARRGFAALAITQFGHPPRLEPWDWSWSDTLPVYGRTSMGRLIADVVLCTDYLLSRPEVDAQRIAISGFSLGGIAAFYGLTIDERLAAAVIFCGGVGSVAHLVRYGTTTFHGAYFYPHGLLSDNLDHPQLVGDIAPRPLLVCAATEDSGMPLEGVKAFEEAAKKQYADKKAPGNFEVLVESGPHAMTMHGFETMMAFLGERLTRHES